MKCFLNTVTHLHLVSRGYMSNICHFSTFTICILKGRPRIATESFIIFSILEENIANWVKYQDKIQVSLGN